MPDKPDMPPPSPDTLNHLRLAVDASAHAPFLYFEDATAFGHINGVIRVTLEACRLIPLGGPQVDVDRVIVGHLRMNLAAARSLKAALEGALLLAEPATSDTRN